VADVIVTLLVPVLRTAKTMLPPENWAFVMDSCSVCINPTLSAPIHAATAMLTATVTAMSMIDATTGLSAFLLFLKFFIFSFIPPFGINEYVDEITHLSLTT
jgi:hypothetical protein